MTETIAAVSETRRVWIGRRLVEKNWLAHVQSVILESLGTDRSEFHVRPPATAGVSYLTRTQWKKFYQKQSNLEPTNRYPMEAYVVNALPLTKNERARALITRVSAFEIPRPPLVLELGSEQMDCELIQAYQIVNGSACGTYRQPTPHVTIGRFAELDPSLIEKATTALQQSLPRNGHLSFFHVSMNR